MLTRGGGGVGEGPCESRLYENAGIPLSFTRFQRFSLCGVQHSFQPNSDETTLI
jgi:hypothetical protein